MKFWKLLNILWPKSGFHGKSRIIAMKSTEKCNILMQEKNDAWIYIDYLHAIMLQFNPYII